MFRTIFFAVLVALLVYNFFTKANDAQKESLYTLIKIVVIICGLGYLILLLVGFVIGNWDTIVDITIKILYCIGGLLLGMGVVVGICYCKEYLRFRLRKKYGLLKKKDKFSFGKDDSEWVKNLSKKDMEIEKKIDKILIRLWFRPLISIPLLFIITIVVMLIMAIIQYS